MSTPPKLQMSDIPQELIDQLEASIEKKVETKFREEQQKQPPRDWLDVLAGPVGTSGLGLCSCCGRARVETRRSCLASRLSCC
ncbi:hypothetical protein HXX76_002646 [Chlamydomonas incerta]|uniref:Uncharacterized protein n=1 Tax=Chlamydomonas incerta TaxID=51695 RepID=A0A835TP15_CHLIN|nr:hypothetical protein HXX76_002646 [Chlamydomonas incerta]|eukprot:KAG2442560.1 hypothetical protein HXX76_002646 [Chlamydomonas incerta]